METLHHQEQVDVILWLVMHSLECQSIWYYTHIWANILDEMYVIEIFCEHFFWFSFLFQFIKVYRKYKAYKFARNMHTNQTDENDTTNRWSMICQITISLVLPALIILIFLPSLIFTYFEGWDYSISVYYSFVTLLTIGFGDFVPTFQPHQVNISYRINRNNKTKPKTMCDISFGLFKTGKNIWYLLSILWDFCIDLVHIWSVLYSNANWIYCTWNAK